MKALKFIIIAVIFFAAGFLVGQSYQLPSAGPASNQQSVNQAAKAKITYILKFGDNELTEFQNVEVTPDQTVLEILKKLTAANNLTLETKDFKDLGIMVDKIGGRANGQNKKYWQFFVNNQYAQTGADKTFLKNGDNVEWRFTSDQTNK